MADKNCFLGQRNLLKAYYENILTSRPSNIYWVQTGVYRNRSQRTVLTLRVQALYTVCSCINLKELHECFLFGVRLESVGQ